MLFVHRLALSEAIDDDRHARNRLAINLVANANLNRLEFIENIKLGHTQSRYAAVNDRATQRYRVKPTATTRPACCRAKFGTDTGEMRAHIIE